MATTQFLFEKGVPVGVKRLVSPDKIAQIVFDTSNGLLKKWEGNLAKKADQLVKGQKTGWLDILKKEDPLLTSGMGSYFLYGDKKYGLSSKEWDYLQLLKSTRALIPFQEMGLREKGEVSEAQVKRSLENLAREAKNQIYLPMVKDFVRAGNSVSKSIENECMNSFGENCVPGEGVKIFNGDLLTAVNTGIIRTTPPNGRNVWKDFFKLAL